MLSGSAASELAGYAPRSQVVARDQEFESDPGGDKDLTDLAKARLHQQEVARTMVSQRHKANAVKYTPKPYYKYY